MKTVLLFLFIMSADMHSLRSVIELPRIPAYYPKVSFRRKRILRYCPLVISFLVKI